MFLEFKLSMIMTNEEGEKNELSVGDSNPGLSRDRRRYLTNYTNRDF